MDAVKTTQLTLIKDKNGNYWWDGKTKQFCVSFNIVHYSPGTQIIINEPVEEKDDGEDIQESNKNRTCGP